MNRATTRSVVTGHHGGAAASECVSWRSPTSRWSDESLNSPAGPAEDTDVSTLESGTILINPQGHVRIVRSRTASDDGWNCTDGAPIRDSEANDATRWAPYTSEQLADALEVARQVSSLSTEPLMAGGIRTWDACSGRPCVLPKLAGVVRDCRSQLADA